MRCLRVDTKFTPMSRIEMLSSQGLTYTAGLTKNIYCCLVQTTSMIPFLRIVYSRMPLREMLDVPINSSDRITYLISFMAVVYSNQRNQKKFMHKTCNGKLKKESIVLYYPKNFFLLDAIDEKIGTFTAAGLIEHWVKNHVNLRYWNPPKEQRERKRLSMTHLRGAFVVYLISCAVACICFFIEHLRYRQ